MDKTSLEATAGQIRDAAFKEKRPIEQLINDFLDSLLELKKTVNKKIGEVREFIAKLQMVTWFDIKHSDEESLKMVNDVIIASRDWASSLRRNHQVCVEKLKKGSLTIEELELFRDTIDHLEEATNDLENAVFFYPKDDDFNNTTNELASLDF